MPEPSDDLLAAADRAFLADIEAMDADAETSVKEQSERYKKLCDDFVTAATEYVKSPFEIKSDVNSGTDHP